VGYAGIAPNPWLDDVKWYDSELMKDRAVIGCCLYQLGGAENFVKMVPQLADYISQMPTLPETEQADPVVAGPDRDANGQPVSDDMSSRRRAHHQHRHHSSPTPTPTPRPHRPTHRRQCQRRRRPL
jgi:hypothetical protein